MKHPGRSPKLLVAAAFAAAITSASTVPAFAAEPECDFPVQQIPLTNQVNISNSVPDFEGIVTDVCGNIISETELPSPTSWSGSGWTVIQTDDGGYTATLDFQIPQVPQQGDIPVPERPELQAPQGVGDVCFSCT